VALLNRSVGRPKPGDLTGWEAFANKIHVEDYLDPGIEGDERLVQGIKYAEQLARRLEQERKPFTVFLGRDPDSDAVTVRFYIRRSQEAPWTSDELEGFQSGEVMAWDLQPD